ncbi:MAG: YmaF family protein [Christensenellales bacterium]
MAARLHTHTFRGVTTYIDGHLHLFFGTTGASPDLPGHTHTVAGRTTMNTGHDHSYSLTTWPPTVVGAGRHYHYFNGNTGAVQGHSHPMSGTTSVMGE